MTHVWLSLQGQAYTLGFFKKAPSQIFLTSKIQTSIVFTKNAS
jgi:hypothetical protein